MQEESEDRIEKVRELQKKIRQSLQKKAITEPSNQDNEELQFLLKRL